MTLKSFVQLLVPITVFLYSQQILIRFDTIVFNVLVQSMEDLSNIYSLEQNSGWI